LEFRDFGGETLCGLLEFDAGTDEFSIPQSWAVRPSILSRKDEPCGAFAGQLHLRAGTRELRIRAKADFRHPDLEARRQSPVLALNVVDDAASRPGQKCRHHQSDAFAGSGRREAQHMLGSIMPEIVATEPSEHDTVRRGKACGANLR
jgi:hypothetical protein